MKHFFDIVIFLLFFIIYFSKEHKSFIHFKSKLYLFENKFRKTILSFFNRIFQVYFDTKIGTLRLKRPDNY